MYRLERARRGKIAFGILAFVFAVLFFFGYGAGGYEMILYGYVNEPLAAIAMVVSLFSAMICLAACLTINGLEKDIAEWLSILDAKEKNEHR